MCVVSCVVAACFVVGVCVVVVHVCVCLKVCVSVVCSFGCDVVWFGFC